MRLTRVEAPQPWLRTLYSEMRPGAKPLLVVEFKEGELPEGPPEAVKIPKATLEALVHGAGFAMKSEKNATGIKPRAAP